MNIIVALEGHLALCMISRHSVLVKFPVPDSLGIAVKKVPRKKLVSQLSFVTNNLTYGKLAPFNLN